MIKKVIAILLVLIICIVIIVGVLMSVMHPPLSKNINDWGAFGGYIGGLLSPIIATLALFALLYTIDQQQKQIKLLAEQSAKEDIWSIIEKIEQDYENTLKMLPIKVRISDNQYLDYSGLDVVSKITFIDYAQVMVNKLDIEEKIKAGKPILRSDLIFHQYEVFVTAAKRLNQLSSYVDEYSKISGNNYISTYFQDKYSIPYQRFIERGYLDTPWN